jgi:hypothetical protein
MIEFNLQFKHQRDPQPPRAPGRLHFWVPVILGILGIMVTVAVGLGLI